MFVTASTHCFSETSFVEACRQIHDLEFSKIELWMSEIGNHLSPTAVAEDPERYYATYREATRLTPVAICIENDISPEALGGICKFAKLLRIAQITLPSSPLGTPFNTEIDRLKSYMRVGGEDGMRISIKTRAGCLTEDPHTAVELCQSVRGLGLTLDPSYYVQSGHTAEALDPLIPYTYHVHLRDSTREQLQVPTGLGEIDYGRLISQLIRSGYDLALSVDLLADYTDSENRSLEMRKLRMLLETLL